MPDKKVIGKIGENLACNYLISEGYIIMARNYLKRTGEIDIIAKDKNFIVFIEVKTRRTINFGYPRESVDYYKQSKMKNVANLYITENNLWNSFIRFDVIEVFIDEKIKATSIKLIKNAFN